ncbi:MAG: hypothetical protein F6J94_25815 [Moorea sp. SIO1F2]|uniref:hypothetical protein n=1 Tax=Moorena sp. SIO1F2 TaxID=2607819 RepID=UPI0013B9C834|nr:hypothetical protein [Moorena sp. SIO1F2]NET85206.1 hypothetical protein [Moorena sp. SIO1F2]
MIYSRLWLIPLLATAHPTIIPISPSPYLPISLSPYLPISPSPHLPTPHVTKRKKKPIDTGTANSIS